MHIRVENFGGMAPRVSRRLLPANLAQIAQNTKLFSGELRGWNVPSQIEDFSSSPGLVSTVYRIPPEDAFANEDWLVFSNFDVDVVRAPLVNDSFYRYYWTGEEAYPAYSPRSAITAGDPPLRLGIPRPAQTPTVTATGGSGEDQVERFYTYTFLSAYGEEGQPAEVGNDRGFDNSTWEISTMDTAPPDAGQRNITHKRIYRTVASETGSAFFFVDEIPIGQSVYTDSKPDTEVVANNVLESTTWAEPPLGLTGLVSTANGFLVGFDGRDVYFSEPYRPHAWPAEYVVSTEYPIVGLGVFANSVVVLTTSAPYVISGVSPANASLIKMDANEPCESKASIISTPVGVYYASPNGLVLVSGAGFDLVTRPVLTEEEWRRLYKPSEIRAARYGTRYFGLNTDFAFIFDYNEPNSAVVHIDELLSELNLPLEPVENIITDNYSGDVFLIYQKAVYLWDATTTAVNQYTWRSKEFEFSRPINLGAGLIQSDASRRFTEEFREELRQYNEDAITTQGPMNPLNELAINASKRDQPLPTDLATTPPKTPLNGSYLFVQDVFVENSGSFFVTLWAEKQPVLDDEVQPNDVQFRCPSGVKSRAWSFEIRSDTPCYSVTFAETGKELARL